MNFSSLRKRNIAFYRRYYSLAGVAALITVAVIVGSLVTGDSVRRSLIGRVSERLGDTETVIFSRNSFINKRVAERLSAGTGGVLLSDGFVSSGGRLIPVTVWGMEGKTAPGSARINRPLASELKPEAGSEIVLRLPATGVVPSGSLFVTSNYTTSLRLEYAGVVGVEEGGNLNLRNEQSLPLNIFVDYGELAGALDAKDRINLVLSSEYIDDKDFTAAWECYDSGIKYEAGIVTSERIFIPAAITASLYENSPGAVRYFAYLANSIAFKEIAIPYSFISATDVFGGRRLQRDEIILSDYAAKRLGAKRGDRIWVSYFVSGDLKNLREDSLQLTVAETVPLERFRSDPALITDFPGLSNVEKCTDWDSDLPIDMKRITKEDEDFWYRYRNTPKAVIAYEAVAERWSNPYGNATAIRADSARQWLALTSPAMYGIEIIRPREAGLAAAREGVDFASLFLALGFFIIVGAILLMLVPLSGMIDARREEIALMKAAGYARKRIVALFWSEAAPVVAGFSLVGVLAGLGYTYIVMKLLGGVWKGATHTDGFALFPNPAAILTGVAAGAALSLIILRIFLVRSLGGDAGKGMEKPLSQRKMLAMALLATIVAGAVVIFNLAALRSPALFVVTGALLIGVTALWGIYLIISKRMSSPQKFGYAKTIWASLYASRRQSLLSFLTLATGIFIVFSVGFNRRSFSDSRQTATGTGGYDLWCESSVPVYHNLSTVSGREKLGLAALPDDVAAVQILRYGGDDASCLNLNRVTNPSVLGVDMEVLAASDFGIANVLSGRNSFALLSQKTGETYPVAVDETVLKWGLIRELGDTLYYKGSGGETVALRICATLKNSIFQGNILIDKKFFREIWSDITGSNLTLIKAGKENVDEIKMLISTAMNEYGVRVTTTSDRLREFNSVTDTYLTIFMTLGSLGVLLGIAGVIVVVRKNLASRRGEIAIYRSIGYADGRIEDILIRENIAVPLFAIFTGILCSLTALGGGVAAIGAGIWGMAGIFVVIFLFCLLFFVRKAVKMLVFA